MFMRLVQLKINTDYLPILREFYEQIVTPELQKMPGCLFNGVIRSAEHPEEVVSMTFWETREQAELYSSSRLDKKFLEQIKPMLAESTEWKIQLSEEMELEYLPVTEEPVLKEYTVTAETHVQEPLPAAYPSMYIRIVSLKLKKDHLAEFRELYQKEILPALQKTKGCRFAYLTENIQAEDEAISVTIWDSKKDADNYEQSGLFEELTDKVKHTFSELFQWKMALEKDIKGRINTSGDLKIAHYNMVSGNRFR
jgi:heme-degrading monooxygenase HmoA